MSHTFNRFLILGTVASSLTACNTMSGIGEDLQAGGHALKYVATKATPDDYDVSDAEKGER